MKQYRLLVRLPNGTTTRIIVTAESDYAAKLIGEAQFGVGNVLHYSSMFPAMSSFTSTLPIGDASPFLASRASAISFSRRSRRRLRDW